MFSKPSAVDYFIYDQKWEAALRPMTSSLLDDNGVVVPTLAGLKGDLALDTNGKLINETSKQLCSRWVDHPIKTRLGYTQIFSGIAAIASLAYLGFSIYRGVNNGVDTVTYHLIGGASAASVSMIILLTSTYIKRRYLNKAPGDSFSVHIDLKIKPRIEADRIEINKYIQDKDFLENKELEQRATNVLNCLTHILGGSAPMSVAVL